MILIPTSTQSWFFRFRLSLALLSASIVLAQSTVSPRWGQAATVVGNTLYIHGGKIDQNNAYSYNSAPNTNELLALNFGRSFDLSSTPWITLNATGGPLVAFHTITAYSTSQALVFGGDAGTSVPLPTRNDSAWQLTINGASASWTSRGEGWADQPMRRQFHSSVLYKDIVYITGGEKVDGSGLAFSQLYAFNPSGPTFTAIAAVNGPPDLVGHAALALGDGRIVVLGGLSRSTSALLPLDTVYIYDAAQSSWSTMTIGGSPTPVPRRNFAATVIDVDKILIHGGADAPLQTALSDGAILDLKKRQWSAVPTLNQALGSRFDHTAVTVGTSVFFFFGFDGTRPVQSIAQLLDLTSNTFLNTFAPTSSTKPNTNNPPNPSNGPSNGNGNSGDGNSSTNGSTSNGIDGNNSGSNNPSDPSYSQPADKHSSSSLPVVLGSVLGVLGLAAAAAIIIIVMRKRRKGHQRNWSSLSEEPEKLVMVDGFGATHREGIVTRIMNVGKPSNMVPVRERFDILADEDTYSARRWGPRREGTAGSSSLGQYGRSREPSTFTSVVNASVTSFRSAFGLGGAPPRLPQSADHTVAMNPYSDTYTAVESPRHSRRQTSFSSYRDPFGDDNVAPEDEYEQAMALQNAGMRPRPVRQSSSGSGISMRGLGGMPYVPLQPIQSITTDSHGSSQGHSNTPAKEPGVAEMAAASAGAAVPSHEGKPKLLTKSPPHSPRRGVITFSTSPPSSPTFGPTNVNRSMSAGSRIGAGLARTVTVISSIFSAEHRGERGAGQGTYDALDFRDPNPPPPRLGAIEEAPTPNLEKGKGRVASLRGGAQQGVYGPGAAAHGRSLSSLKTANSEALERLGGKWEVVQRVDTNDTAASRSLLDEEFAHTVRSHSLDIPTMESPEQSREQTRPPWKPLALRSASSSTRDSRTMQPPPMPPPKRTVSTGVAARIQAFENRASVDLSSTSPISIPPSSPVTPSKKRTYGLVPKPTLFIANPGRGASTDS